jgi:gamma-glutamyl hercynylcysteine S-oxide synthase
VDPRPEIRSALERARAGTEELLAPVSDEELTAEIAPAQSPLAWDLGHIAYFEELWLLRNLEGRPAVSEQHDEVYGAVRHEPRGQSVLRILPPEAAREYGAEVREQALRLLARADLNSGSPLLRKGFIFGLVLQHELQHQETMLQKLQARTGREYAPAWSSPAGPAPEPAPAGPSEVEIQGGSFFLGAVDEPWAYDNELVPHEMEVRPFFIDRTPVSNGAFMEFVEDGSYRHKKLWTTEGWAWRTDEDARAPLYWEKSGDGWERIRFGRREAVPTEEPVQHVCFHEAEAFARWAGKRLPTEAEWERAAGWDERAGKSRFPWGRESMGYEANLGHRRFSPAPAGSYPGGQSPVGCLQLAGDVWEWTSSFFQPYPGFVAFPYAECSEVFFGETFRVLRGGSWATDPVVARVSFRKWEYPSSRQIFAGFRCARDAS